MNKMQAKLDLLFYLQNRVIISVSVEHFISFSNTMEGKFFSKVLRQNWPRKGNLKVSPDA